MTRKGLIRRKTKQPINQPYCIQTWARDKEIGV